MAYRSLRPTIIGRRHAVACGHPLAALAAMRVLDAGGNAVDAGTTAAMALSVLQPDLVSFAGVAPTLIYTAKENRVVSLAGLGTWPAATDVERLIAEGDGKSVPEGLLRTIVPAAPATHIEALRRYGTISFKQAATPAMEIAGGGFAMYPLLADKLRDLEASYRRWPQNAQIYLPAGRPPRTGEIFRQEDLARTFLGMIEAEHRAPGDRDRKLHAAHDYFYRGPVAQAVARYHAENGGFLTLADFAGFEVPVEDSLRVAYRGYEVHTGDVWCQGITLLETLKILEGIDLARLGHNSPDYVHMVAEALNLSFSDREAYVGDPKFVDVPTAGLLSDLYTAYQSSRIDPHRAFAQMPAPGNPANPGTPGRGGDAPSRAFGEVGVAPDTICACVIDGDGNAYAATVSDNSYDSPVIPGIGLTMSSRGHQSRLAAGHPARVAPGKRPRLTPFPALAFSNGRVFLTLGTPGGDVQSQAMLQVFFNLTAFGMELQQAVEVPRFSTANFPNSFTPNEYLPGRLCLEADLPHELIEEMRKRGHDVQVMPRLPAAHGGVCAVMQDLKSGLRHAAADPRRTGYALAW